MTTKNNDEAALPRHWLATTDNPRPDDHPAPTSRGGAPRPPGGMWLTRSVIIATPYNPSVGLHPGWIANEVLQWVQEQYPDALAPTDCWPYDPNPPAKTPAENGYRYCDDCDSVVEAKGHECGDVFSVVSRGRQLLDAEARAEFAESVLFGAMWDHEIRPFGHAYVPECAFCVLRGPK